MPEPDWQEIKARFLNYGPDEQGRTVKTYLMQAIGEIERLRAIQARYEERQAFQFPISTLLAIYLPQLWRKIRSSAGR